MANKLKIEDHGIIQNLNAYVEKLPEEHRADVYRFAQSFLNVGQKNGILVASGIGNTQDEMLEYLSRKQADCQQPKKP